MINNIYLINNNVRTIIHHKLICRTSSFFQMPWYQYTHRKEEIILLCMLQDYLQFQSLPYICGTMAIPMVNNLPHGYERWSELLHKVEKMCNKPQFAVTRKLTFCTSKIVIIWVNYIEYWWYLNGVACCNLLKGTVTSCVYSRFYCSQPTLIEMQNIFEDYNS